jgi:amino acid permease
MFSKELFKNYIYPIVVFSGGMIGVGFLSLPYIAMTAGIWLVLCYLLLLVTLVITLNLIFADISLKTPDFKRFPGFVGFYLGKWGKFVAMISMIFGTYGVLLAYLIIGGEFLSNVFKPLFGGSSLIYTFVYFLVASSIIYFGIKAIARVEFWILAVLFVSLFLIFIEGFSQIRLSNIFAGGLSYNWQIGIKNFFLPYGPILFALWGIGIMPDVEEMLIGKKKIIKRIITISTLIVVSFYVLFIFVILGITGNQTTQTALTGLVGFLGPSIVSISLLIGALATFTGFITQGVILKKIFEYDMGVKHHHAFIITCLTPLILFLIGLKTFIPLISFVGGVLLGADGILILLMYKKIGGKKFIIYPLTLVFVLGVIYEIIYFVK